MERIVQASVSEMRVWPSPCVPGVSTDSWHTDDAMSYQLSALKLSGRVTYSTLTFPCSTFASEEKTNAIPNQVGASMPGYQ